MARLMSLSIVVLAGQVALVPAMVGLWDYPPIYVDAAGRPMPVPVHANASRASAVIARLDRAGITGAADGVPTCRWVRDLERLASPGGCVFTESDYEVPALAVFERQGDWLRIALDEASDRFGWIEAAGGFHSLVDLLAGERATYLTDAWDRTLYGAPAEGRRLATGALSTGSSQPYRAIGHAVTGGRLWLHVELFDGVCGPRDPRVVDTGWVPAQSAAGGQLAWFWSRGC